MKTLMADTTTGVNLSNDYDPLPIPPLDPLFLFTSASDDLGFDFDDNCDFELTFDDLDNLYFPSESEAFLLPSETVIASPESGASGISGNHTLLDVDTFLNCSSPQNSNSNSNSNGDDCGREFSGVPSDNCGSGVLSAPSPDSGNFVVDQKIKVESVVSKRKKDKEETISESRSCKYRRSSLVDENENDNISEEDVKRKARLMRNRESAQLSRQRKKHYVEELEDKLRAMHSTIADLNGKISYFMAENVSLRQQLSGGGNAMPQPPPPPPHMGMYSHPHMAPVPYPWMPCATPYMVKAQGSQVPLVPIPRLKPQQTVSSSKPKKSDTSKTKTKKVASVSFLGLFIFMLLFGGLLPFMNDKYGGMGDAVSGGYFSNRSYDQHRGRVLAVNGHPNETHGMGFGTSNGKIGITDKLHCERDIGNTERASQSSPGADEFVRMGNSSEPLVASLYVPRNDKLVKIDGNLIIHSIMASEKATASREAPQANNNNNRETGLAIPKDLTPALAISDVRANSERHSHLYRNPTERPKALSSGYADALKDHMKSNTADGKLQQWFREGLAGPLLSSGTCTEVFQFDVSPASAAGAIIPASSVANISVEHRKNVTHANKGRNRRILHGLPAPLNVSDLNVTREHGKRNSQNNSFEGNKSASSMVVSVLVDPREGGDGDVDGMITPKSLSRIFVVVLFDSVKYVTYSCALPRSGPHLVTT